MHISITDDLKKRFHAACALQGLKMSQVVAKLIEQWLKVNQALPSGVESNTVTKDKAAKS